MSIDLRYSANESQLDLVIKEEEEDVLYLALEEDGEHPYVHFPHCKVYLVLTLGWVLLVTLSVPIGIGYARPALISFDFKPSQCEILIDSIKAFDDKSHKMAGKKDAKSAYEDALSRSRCNFAVIPLCYQKTCRCLQMKVNITTAGRTIQGRMIYDFEDTYLNYPHCSINPCSEDYVFENFLTQVSEKKLRCFANEKVAIHDTHSRDYSSVIFGALIVPLFLILAWLILTLYVLKRTWRVTRRDFKQAVEFRFNAWPSRPAHSVRASIPNSARSTMSRAY